MADSYFWRRKYQNHSCNFLLGQNIVANDPINDPIKDSIKLESREEKIIELLRAEPGLNRREMAERLDCSDSTIKRTLQRLVQNGIIKRIGSNKKGEWIILYGEKTD